MKIINYQNGFIRFTDMVRLFPITKNVNVFRSGLKTMRQRVNRVRKFHAFIQDNMRLTCLYHNELEMKLHPPEADVYICGSDQIWNPFLTFGVSGSYYLDFVKGKRQKISYAPSFGTSHLPFFFHKKIKKCLLSFDALSVRELEGIGFINRLIRKTASRLIDPTFLLDREEWGQLAVEPENQRKYILLYIMQQDEEMYSHAGKLKERLGGLQLVEISRYGYKPDCVDVTLVDVGQREFLGLFKNAEYICTNSYHGFVFSLLFEKRFCLIPCKRFRTRIYNLANILSIDIPGPDGDSVCSASDIEYDKNAVRCVIKQERKKAFEYLNEAILNFSVKDEG